jgi:hypothetical protein
MLRAAALKPPEEASVEKKASSEGWVLELMAQAGSLMTG